MTSKSTQSTWLQRPQPDSPCAIIAEIAQAHDGSLGMAHAFIDAIATTGATAVKFQTHIAAAESTAAEPWRTRFSLQDQTRYDYWRRMEFTPEQWQGLKKHCEDKGLAFLSTPFSEPAFELLREVGVAGWKVASGEISNRPLLEKMARTGLPVLLSTGMSDLAEIDRAVQWLTPFPCPLAVMQCTSRYPSQPEDIGLNLIQEFRKRYGISGLSDHSGTIFPGLAAVTLGAKVIEVHVTLSRYMFGPDVPASLTIEELGQLAAGIRFTETMLANPHDKSTIPEPIRQLRSIFMKSLVAATDLQAGTQLTEAMLAIKKPATGIPPFERDQVIGKRLRHALKQDQPLTWQDMES